MNLEQHRSFLSESSINSLHNPNPPHDLTASTSKGRHGKASLLFDPIVFSIILPDDYLIHPISGRIDVPGIGTNKEGLLIHFHQRPRICSFPQDFHFLGSRPQAPRPWPCSPCFERGRPGACLTRSGATRCPGRKLRDWGKDFQSWSTPHTSSIS